MGIINKIKENIQRRKEAKAQKERDAFLQEIKENPSIMTYSDFQKYKYDREIAMIYIKDYPNLYYYLPEEFQQERDFVMQCAKHIDFLHIPKQYLNDKEFLLDLVKAGIEYNPPEEGDSPHNIRVPCKSMYCTLEDTAEGYYIRKVSKSSPWFDDETFMDEIIKINPKNAIYASPRLFDTKEYVLKVVEIDASNVIRASRRLRKDDDVAMKAVTQNGLALQYLPEQKNNPAICYAACQKNIGAWDYVGETTQKKFIKKFFKNPPKPKNNQTEKNNNA